jgi:PAS domain S-box-containing protein
VYRWHLSRGVPHRNSDGAIVRWVGTCTDIDDLKQALAALRESEAKQREIAESLRLQGHLLASVRQAIITTDTRGCITSWNRHAEVMYGWTAEEAIGQDIATLMFPEGKCDDAGEEAALALKADSRVDRERQIRTKDGTLIWVSVTAAPILDIDGKVTHIIGSSIDITERRRLEQQYRQAQKMEAVGRLAGGVAHDFNNLLTVIKGHAEFLSRFLPEEGEARDDIDQIAKAAQRASLLTRQLLAFSRQQVMERQVIEPNALLMDLEKMLTRLIGENIDVVVVMDPRVPSILADSGQLEQAVMNLVVNARDAMPDGGSLEIATKAVMVTASDVSRHADARVGLYAAITVKDTGVGIHPDLLIKIFEPFFTTKDSGRGTGLGLATVYGIAQQLGGFIDVTSSVGEGSTFALHLPAASADYVKDSGERRPGPVPGDELIMIVEDQDEVRAVARRILLTHGYRVVEARNGLDALSILDTMESGVDLVVTDAVMPQMGGPDLVRALRVSRPKTPVVMVSGYTDHELDTYGARQLNVPFLHKPFRGEDLLRVVRTALEDSKSYAGR